MSRSGAGDVEADPTRDTVKGVTPLLAVGCGGDEPSAVADGDAAPSASRSGGEAPLDAEAADAINLRVVADGSQVALADVAATDRPTLLWFWAPF